MKKTAIIADTSCETNEQIREKYGITYAPFKISIDEKTYVDDDNLNIDEMIEDMKSSPNPIKTSCPSPGEFKDALLKNVDADELYIITISKKVSGSYEAASLAAKLFIEEYPEKKVYVFDSKSAVSGETNVYVELCDLIEKGFEFEKIVEELESFIDRMNTLFVLEDLSSLVKNGRMKRPVGALVDILSIMPIMKAGDGEIELYEISRGMKKSLSKMVNAIGQLSKNKTYQRIVITHVRAMDKAEFIAEKIKKLYNFKDILIMQSRGLSSGYASDRGIVIAFE